MIVGGMHEHKQSPGKRRPSSPFGQARAFAPGRSGPSPPRGQGHGLTLAARRVCAVEPSKRATRTGRSVPIHWGRRSRRRLQAAHTERVGRYERQWPAGGLPQVRWWRSQTERPTPCRAPARSRLRGAAPESRGRQRPPGAHVADCGNASLKKTPARGGILHCGARRLRARPLASKAAEEKPTKAPWPPAAPSRSCRPNGQKVRPIRLVRGSSNRRVSTRQRV